LTLNPGSQPAFSNQTPHFHSLKTGDIALTRLRVSAIIGLKLTILIRLVCYRSGNEKQVGQGHQRNPEEFPWYTMADSIRAAAECQSLQCAEMSGT
jgi:hypothetical protein